MKTLKLFLVAIIVIATQSLFGQNSWYVSINGSDQTGDGTLENPLRTIQNAINISGVGDSILVLPGVYQEALYLGETKNFLTIKSTSGPETTTIIKPLGIHLITIRGSQTSINLEGFTLKRVHNEPQVTVAIDVYLAEIYVSRIIAEGFSIVFMANTAHFDVGNSIFLNNGLVFWSTNTYSLKPKNNVFHSTIFEAGKLLEVHDFITVHEFINTLVVRREDSPHTGFYVQSFKKPIFRNVFIDQIIDVDPVSNYTVFESAEEMGFQDMDSYNLLLRDYSPAIGSGALMEGLPSTDFLGNLRPNPEGSNPDIGAYEHILGSPIPIKVVLESPANESSNVLIDPILQWKVLTNADYYSVQISTEPYFSNVLFTLENVESSSIAVEGLSYSQTYFWRVNATNESGTGAWSDAWSFSTLVPPAAPELAIPVDGSINLPATTELSWNEVSLASYYSVQVSTQEDFSEIQFEIQNIEGITVNVSGLDYSTLYYWRVNASNEAGTSPWSEAWSLTTLVPPGAPQLLYPSDGTENLAINLNLQWSAPQIMGRYIKLDSYFSSDNGQVNVHEIRVFFNGENKALNKPGYANSYEFGDWESWGSNVVDGNDYSKWSSNRNDPGPDFENPHYVFIDLGEVFLIDSIVVNLGIHYQTFSINTSVDGINWIEVGIRENLNHTNTFSSYSSSKYFLGGVNYRVQVALDDNFINVFEDVTEILLTSITISDLSYETTYHWRVNASNEAGTGPWSEVWSFTTLAPPPSPSLASPSNGSMNLPITPELSWGLVDYADNYGIQVSAQEDFFVIQFEAQNIEGTTAAVSGLDYSTQYYWRVNASNEAGTGPWSEIWNFTTLIPPAAPSLASPNNGSANLPVSPELSWGLVDFAVTYGIQVSAQEDFLEIQFEMQNIEGTTVDVSGLDYSTQYYWRVNASNEAGTGPWSEVWNFETLDYFELVVLSGATYCQGDFMNLGVSLNAPFEEGNVFTVELSDINGSFETPIVLEEIQTNLPFNAEVSVPDTLSLEVTYLLRVRSSSPEAYSEAFPVTFYGYPGADLIFSSDALCWGGTAEIVYANNVSAAMTFTWDFDGGSVISGEGAGPYLVSWPTAGYKNIFFSVEANGCVTQNTGGLFVAHQTQPNPICMVTVNEDNKNTILFEQPETNAYEAFAIYKEGSQAGVYLLIGHQPANGPGYFVDENSNPAQNSSRYKIAVIDTCGYETPMSDFHKTMHLTINAGINGSWNLIWDKYEGFDFSTFFIYRGTSEGSLNLIAELPSNLFTYSDQAPPAGTVFYQIEVVNPNPCDVNMEKSSMQAVASSRSNLVNTQQATSIDGPDLNHLAVWPNPTKGILYIQGDFTPGKREVEVVSISGKVLKKVVLQGDENEINLSDLPEGLYFLRMLSGNQIYYKQIMKL
jgi:hypothetical protein